MLRERFKEAVGKTANDQFTAPPYPIDYVVLILYLSLNLSLRHARSSSSLVLESHGALAIIDRRFH